MKPLLLFVLVMSAQLLCAQEDTTKYLKYNNAYGIQHPRIWANKVLRTPYSDTSAINAQPGAIQAGLDGNPYWWNGIKWVPLAGQDLTEYLQFQDSLTKYVTPKQLGDSLNALIGGLGAYVKYDDSTTTFVTPTQLNASYTWERSLDAINGNVFTHSHTISSSGNSLHFLGTNGGDSLTFKNFGTTILQGNGLELSGAQINLSAPGGVFFTTGTTVALDYGGLPLIIRKSDNSNYINIKGIAGIDGGNTLWLPNVANTDTLLSTYMARQLYGDSVTNISATYPLSVTNPTSTPAITLDTANWHSYNYYNTKYGDVSTAGSYANPSWITGLAWSKITGPPNTLAGYGIADAYPLSGNPSGFVTASSTNTLTNKTIAAGSNTITGLTNSNLSGSAGISNANLANNTISGVLLGSNLFSHAAGRGLTGSTYNGSGAQTWYWDSTLNYTITGNWTFNNKITGTINNADSLNHVAAANYATLTGTQTLTNKTIAAGSNTVTGLTNANLSGSAGITNANLANSTISGINLGLSLASHTAGRGLIGTSYNGALARTWNWDSTLNYTITGNWTFNNKIIGNINTADSLNHVAAANYATLTGTQTLTNKTIAAGSNTITGLTNSNLSGSAGITNANLANSTISGVALGSNLNNLTPGRGLTGSAYNGSASQTVTIDTAKAYTWLNSATFTGSLTVGTLSNATAGDSTVTVHNGVLGKMATATFIDSPEHAYTGTITWTGTTAPSGTTSHTYEWQRNGNWVILTMALNYSVGGTSLTQVAMALPTDVPLPKLPAGFSGASTVFRTGSGQFASATTGLAASPTKSLLRVNAANTGYELVILTNSAGSQAFAYLTISYPVN